jgi:periplasmic divalent cation tolerance protein
MWLTEMGEYFIVYVTTESKSEAEALAESLVKDRLVACVNYLPVNSVYTWNSRLEHSSEYLLICKTTKARLKDVESRITAEHSYECPEVISVKIHDGSRDYLKWVEDSTK